MAAVAGITAGAAVLSSILSGLFSSSSQKSANQTNLEIARETNAQNKELFNQQLAWAEDMWNKTNEWNSPKNQMDMLRKAGINPALGSQWQTTSQPGTPSAPQMQGATMQPVDYSWIGNSVTTGVNAYYNNSLTNEVTRKASGEAMQAKVKAELDAYALKYNLMKIINDADSSGYAKEQAKIQLDILNRTQEYSVRQAEWQTDIMQKEYEKAINDIAESKLRQAAQNIANQYAPELNEQQLRQYQANIKAAYSAAAVNDAAAVESAARKALTDLQAEGVKLSNQEKESIMDAIIDKAWIEADNAYKSGKQIEEMTGKISAETRKLTNQDRYGELGYRMVGSALPDAERRVKQGIKYAIKGKRYLDRSVDRSKRDIELRKAQRRHSTW